MFALGQYLDMTKHMTQEDKQKYLNYVWVDSICSAWIISILGQYILTALSIHAYHCAWVVELFATSWNQFNAQLKV